MLRQISQRYFINYKTFEYNVNNNDNFEFNFINIINIDKPYRIIVKTDGKITDDKLFNKYDNYYISYHSKVNKLYVKFEEKGNYNVKIIIKYHSILDYVEEKNKITVK